MFANEREGRKNTNNRSEKLMSPAGDFRRCIFCSVRRGQEKGRVLAVSFVAAPFRLTKIRAHALKTELRIFYNGYSCSFVLLSLLQSKEWQFNHLSLNYLLFLKQNYDIYGRWKMRSMSTNMHFFLQTKFFWPKYTKHAWEKWSLWTKSVSHSAFIASTKLVWKSVFLQKQVLFPP